MSFNFRRFTPGGGGGGNYGIVDTTILDHHTVMRNKHTIGVGEPGFIKFPDARPGFTTVVKTSIDQIYDDIRAMGVNDKILFKARWNGVSNPSNYQVNGPSNAAMSANGSIDWGFNRPNWSVIIEPDTGFTPEIGAPSFNTSLETVGWHWFEFRNMIFSGNVEFNFSYGFRNGLAVGAMLDCTFKGQTIGWNARTIHIDRAKYSGLLSGAKGLTEYFRIWNFESSGMGRSIDFCPNFSYDHPVKSQWFANTWLANGVHHHMQYDDGSANHFDWLQTNTAADRHKGYNTMVEHCMINADCADSQLIFGDDISEGVGAVIQENNQLFHNNLLIGSANEGIHLFDPSGKGTCVAHRNTIARASVAPPVQDTRQNVTAHGNNVNAGGKFIVTENFLPQILDFDRACPITASGNTIVDPRFNITPGTNRMQDRFTGNGTWGTDPVTSFHKYTLDFADNRTAAKSAMRNFFLPIVGGFNGSGGSVGIVDPNDFPVAVG